MKRIIASFAAIAACATNYAAEERIGANISSDTVWTADNTYILDDQIYIIDGAVLTIEPGTVIKGAPSATAATALIVTRGSKIYAAGTSDAPIIFTAEDDLLDGSLGPDQTSLWGGVIILGAAPVNSQKLGIAKDSSATPAVDFTVENIEGLTNSPDNDYTEFGGTDPDDNSGIFRYVSIRHGGAVVGSNNEINGLTMGGVGRGTIIEFVEVFANKDDGFEWFGGTVDARFLVAAFGNDDSFDYDQGWRGKGQFWFTIGDTGLVASEAMDHAGEHDGTVDFSSEETERGLGTIYNATYIGTGSEDEGIFEVSDDAGVRYYNSIFRDFAKHGVDVLADAEDGLIDQEDGVARIDFESNIWWNIGNGGTLNTTDVLSTNAVLTALLVSASKNNAIEDPMFYGISRTTDGGLDPRPVMASGAWSNTRFDYPNDPWYIQADYQGAFGETNWLYGWTKLSQDGYLPAARESSASTATSVSATTSVADGSFTNINVVVEGELPRLFIIRARGRKLIDDQFDPNAVMDDPQIEITQRYVHNGQIERLNLPAVTGWIDREDVIEVLGARVGLSTLRPAENRPTDDETAAVAVMSLNPGVYVIKVTDEAGAGGAVQTAAWMLDR
ncbi:MAG: hypothetical protein AAGB46_08085 [Verrucomicrobiota bacterium]